MASFADLDTLARALPEVEVRFSRDDRPEYRVRGRLFAGLRARRKDALDAGTGEPLDDVVMIRTPDLARKVAGRCLTPAFARSPRDGRSAGIAHDRRAAFDTSASALGAPPLRRYAVNVATFASGVSRPVSMRRS